MASLLFWVYIGSLVFCSISFVSAFVLSCLTKTIYWIKHFLWILGTTTLMILAQGVFFYLFELSEHDGSLLDNIYFSLTVLIGYSLIVSFLSLAWRSIELPPSRTFFLLISLFSIYCLLVILSKWIFPPSVLLTTMPFSAAAAVMGSSIFILLQWKTIRIKESGKFLLIFSLAALAGYLFEFLEFFLRKWALTAFYSIPIGSITFVGFGLILCWVALLFSLNMIKAIKSSSGKRGVSPEQQQLFSTRWNLTQREREIVSLLLLRFTHKEIGEKLYISSRTVERHVYNLYQKAGISNRFELYDMIVHQA